MIGLALGLAGPAGAQSPDTVVSQADVGKIDRYVEWLLREERVPGAALAIVRGDRIVHLRGFGTDSRGRQVTGQTSFVLGSMSKSVTALAVMQLVERGRIGLDVPVRHYLPSFRLGSADSGASVTVRHLLLHTSGIPHGAGRGRGGGESLGSHVAALRHATPRSSVGAEHAYASPNYLVLGALVEAVSGGSFAAYVEREIFQPLAMHNSFTARGQAVARRFAGGHVYVGGFPMVSSVPEESGRLPTAGLMSSAEDLSHFLVMQLQGGRFGDARILDESSVAQMQTGGVPSTGFSYAFGWRDGSIGGTRAVHHGGIVADFRGKMVMLPDSGWGVVVLTNVSSAIPWPLVPASHRLADDIAAYLAGRPLPPAKSRHRLFFGVVSAVMLLIVAAQLRTLWRAWRGPTTHRAERARPYRFWLAVASDAAFVVAMALLPRFVGLTWADFFRGGPDVAWWLIGLAALGTATVGLRVMRSARRTI